MKSHHLIYIQEAVLIGMSRVEDKKWTLEEALEECAEMEKGEKHLTEDYIAKIGAIRKCHDCGKDVDVISYGSYMLDHMSIAHCSEHEYEFKPSNCKSETCEVHGGENGFDEDEYMKKSDNIGYIRKEVKKMLEEIKPKNDSILEYDRMNTLFGHSHSKMKPADYDFWLYNGFIDYFGLQGKLTLK